MTSSMAPPEISLEAITQQIELVRQQNEFLVRELKAGEREVYDLI